MKVAANLQVSGQQPSGDSETCVFSGSILYIFKGGRQVRVNAIDAGTSPSEFLYGCAELRDSGCAVELWEQGNLPPGKLMIPRFYRYWLAAVEWALSRWFGIAFPWKRYASVLPDLNRFDVIVAVPDAIGFTLGYLRYRGWLYARVIVVCAATAMKLENIRRRETPGYRFVRRFIRHALSGCDRALALGEGEVCGLEAELGQLPQLSLLPFGVDVRFWYPNEDRAVAKFEVLFVGNDFNRDYELLVRIAQKMPEVRFRFVTGMLTADTLPENVELIKGDWHGRAVSDEDMRGLYQQSTMVILPLKDTFQPSGQSVCLQAMACGAPVVISRTKGFWEADAFIDSEHCIFVEDAQPAVWVTAIRRLLQDGTLCQQLALNARNLIEQRYDIVYYAREMHSHMCELQNCGVTLES